MKTIFSSPLKNDPDELLELWDGIRIVGAAPEIDGGLQLGNRIVSHGAVASIAHSGASYEIVEEALKYGYSDVTHISSACSSCFKVNLFRVGGVVEAGLSIDGLTTQAIADLRHLPAGILKLIYKCKVPKNDTYHGRPRICRHQYAGGCTLQARKRLIRCLRGRRYEACRPLVACRLRRDKLKACAKYV
ncbi:MAG: hypothetical protein ACOX45_00095 [Acutalibacteraceae bacterium]